MQRMPSRRALGVNPTPQLSTPRCSRFSSWATRRFGFARRTPALQTPLRWQPDSQGTAGQKTRGRVGAPVAEGPSQGTVLVLFTYGSSGHRVVTPVAGRFTTSPVPVAARAAPERRCAQCIPDNAAVVIRALVHPNRNSEVLGPPLACGS